MGSYYFHKVKRRVEWIMNKELMLFWFIVICLRGIIESLGGVSGRVRFRGLGEVNLYPSQKSKTS